MKKAKLFVTLFISLILVTGCGNKEAKNDTNNLNNNTNANNTNTTEKQSKISVVKLGWDGVAILIDNSVYVNIYGATNEVNMFGTDAYNTLLSTRQNYKEYSFDNFEYLSGVNDKFTGMKLNTKNVKKVLSYTSGQAIGYNDGLILLNNDKIVSIISLYSLINGKTEVKNITELSDIEDIVVEKTPNEINVIVKYYAINKNGEKFDLSNYIPKDYKQF